MDGLDEADGIFLGGVGSGLVQDMDPAQVILDLAGGQGAKADVGGLDERGKAAGGAVLDPDA